MKFISIVLFLLFSICRVGFAYADGISTDLAKLLIDDLRIGHSYRVSQEDVQILTAKGFVWTSDVFLRITNTSAIEKDVYIMMLEFTEADMEGYEVIPDMSWIEPETDYFPSVGSNETVQTDIIITIPDDRQYLGKKYEAKILSYIQYQGIIGIGVISKIYFSISSEVQEISNYRPQRKIITPNNDGINDYAFFSGFSATIYIYDITGKKIKTINCPPYRWDGRDDEEKFVETGVYIYQFEVDGELISGMIAVAK